MIRNQTSLGFESEKPVGYQTTPRFAGEKALVYQTALNFAGEKLYATRRTRSSAPAMDRNVETAGAMPPW